MVSWKVNPSKGGTNKYVTIYIRARGPEFSLLVRGWFFLSQMASYSAARIRSKDDIVPMVRRILNIKGRPVVYERWLKSASPSIQRTPFTRNQIHRIQHQLFIFKHNPPWPTFTGSIGQLTQQSQIPSPSLRASHKSGSLLEGSSRSFKNQSRSQPPNVILLPSLATRTRSWQIKA